MKKDRINISMDTETLQALKQLAEDNHCSASQMVTQLVWDYIKRKERE